MARWHGKLCSEPRVTVRQDGNPCCDSCGIKCDWQELIKTQAFANSPYLIPQNEKPGELNLWWPSSVPYSAKSKDNSTTQSPVPPTNTQHSPTPVYPTVLASHEFRLVCLDANENPESPVHLTIEAFPQDDAPDYETVSYTWGGEAADSTPTKPIFIGPYWDVVFQTTNCWEMLRFIRPWRGIRMIWVDAICINQQSNLERADQVASMMQIYRNCTRVIVYLGPDIAVPPHGRFPPRRRLDDLALGPDQDQAAFKKLLQRRYFRRIWVIQELILPPQAVIPIRGVNYWADAMVYSRLKSVPDWDWNKTAAPWLQHTAQGGIWEGDLAHILRTTAKSRSSDPRDQVFGILGLVNHGPTFQADYGISAQHVFVGLFAHLISNLKFLDIFYHATGASPRSRTSLTWMPLWDLTSTWDTTFDPPPPLDMIMADTLIRSLKPAVKVSCYINFNNSWSRVVGSPHTSAASRGNVSRYIKLSSSQSVTEAHTTSIAFAGWQRATSTHKPWHTGLSFDAGAGTLSLVLTHFCPIPLQPKKIGSLGEWTMFEVRGSQGSLFLASRDPLDLIYHPNQDHLFILNPGEGSELWYLVLRLVGDSGRWTLVSTCRAMFLSLDADASDIAKGVEIRIEPGFQSLYQLLEPAARAFENRQLDEIAGILPEIATTTS
ncbi:heterokaryon incompatibility protein-domain-containing protein [Podospora fimiseda]|uniref:Heterokaryon incompatibility protein-domain-containing protein n=1 Tax=Podospora fimiseda TaxID=252190 RepID=A0AAN6YRC4_9PEZI|nr:heterokaryon incompatibility protein-domain-containing protein [Podospora fimiseda]